MEYPIRINKYLREFGYASRREADALVASGKVTVNGWPAKIGMLVQQDDKVEVRQTERKNYRYLRYYKPRGLPTQAPEGTESVITKFKPLGLFPIGRLDKESEGLMVLTNDGRVTRNILGADSKFEKEYMVKVRETLREGVPAIFAKGMETEIGTLLPAEAKILDEHTIRVVLHEGRKHQIRVMLSELGYTVRELKRVRVGNLTIKGLSAGQSKELSKSEIETILKPA